MASKLSLTQEWMKAHPDDEPCPQGSGGAARAWRLKRGIGASWVQFKQQQRAERAARMFSKKATGNCA
jgi:hypothetical protein